MKEEQKNQSVFHLQANSGGFLCEGMTLMDYYAGLALQAVLSNPSMGEALRTFSDKSMQGIDDCVSITCFRIAKSMLKIREQKIKDE